jgi:diaminohydroxyphosphoribosylaminopyrimidine deaminase/5-amino-6-(5-phosphoribosylamino)uracil reductase
MSPELDEQFIRRAIRLAMNGRGRVEPNPMVGCVLVKDGRVIGEGCHAQFGGPHAEPTALANCTESPAGATAYVTLEPCCHTNKKTPPCTPRLIEARIARVVIGCLDPNPDVNGKGVAMLRAAGIQVNGPVLEAAAKQLIAPFLARVEQSRPYVTLKWAETSDAKIAGPNGRPIRLSNDESWRLVHELRTRCDAILVGAGTALNDNPYLTARVERIRNPLRVVLDSRLRLDQYSNLAQSTADAPVLIFHDPARSAPQNATALRALGVELVSVEGDKGIPLDRVLDELSRRNVTHVLVEPGPTLAAAFYASGFADRAWRFRTNRVLNDSTAPAAEPVPRNYVQSGETDVAGDLLTEYLNPASRVFFAPEPSADLIFARATTTSSRP